MKKIRIIGFLFGLIIIIGLTVSTTIDSVKSWDEFRSAISVNNVKADMDPIKDAEDAWCITPPETVGCLRWTKHTCQTGILCGE